MIRLLSTEIRGFKAIGHGVIEMPCKLSHFKESGVDITGIYGQNGSGKTCVIEVMRLLRTLWTGARVDDEKMGNFVRTGDERMEVRAELQYWDGVNDYTLFYEVVMKRVEKEGEEGRTRNGVTIEKESLRVKEEGKKYARKETLVACDVSNGFKSDTSVQDARVRKKLKEYFHDELDLKLSSCAQNVVSYIFCTELREALQQVDEEKAKFVRALHQYAIGKLIIVGRSEAGLIACNFAQPLNIYLPGKGSGQLPLPLSGSGVIPVFAYGFAQAAIDSINLLLPVLIRDCTLSLRHLGEEINRENEKCVRCQLMVRHGAFEGPLAYESEGIKRLISILHLLIGVYNHEGVTVAVDELDSGIYEYLLGEILQTLKQGAKGQLIFTAHNLRPLEMLDAYSVLFTTNNPEERFTRFASSRVKTTTNMRNMYMRVIQLGGENLDVETSIHSSEIARGFRRAAQYDAK